MKADKKILLLSSLIILTSILALTSDKVKYLKTEDNAKFEIKQILNNNSENHKAINCVDKKEKTGIVDELSLLLENKENPDSCLFVGCSGFF